jgi:hypothetical protein
MIDFEKLQKDVAKMETDAAKFADAKKADPQAMKAFVAAARDVLTTFLKDRKEQIRPGHIFQNAAAKSIIPTDIAARGDALLIRWGGSVTPTDARAIEDDAAKLAAVAQKLLPVLKAYRKEEK